MKPGPKLLRGAIFEACMNDLEPDDIPLNFSYVYMTDRGRVRRGERKRETERQRDC